VTTRRHDHEHAVAEQINFHVHNAAILNAFCDLRPDFLVVLAVLGNQRGIIFQVQSETKSAIHDSSVKPAMVAV
jgi:hypothetical protein